MQDNILSLFLYSYLYTLYHCSKIATSAPDISTVKTKGEELPCALSGKESANAGDMASIPDPILEDPTYYGAPKLMQLLRLCSRPWEPQLLSSRAAITEVHVP